MNVLSLFDGISCGRVALERAGIKIDKYYASEVDQHAIKIAMKNYPDTIQVGDVTKLKGEDFKNIDMIIGGSPCFAKGTFITTKDRGLIPIEEVKRGDFVLTHKNRFKKVLKTMKRKSKHINSLDGLGIKNLLVTDEHPFYSRKMYHQYVSHDSAPLRLFEKPKWVICRDLKKGVYLGNAINKLEILPKWNGIKSIINQTTMGFKNNLNKHFNDNIFWWMIGRYLADGWIINGKRNNRKNSFKYNFIICCGKHEEKQLEKELSKTGFYFCKSEARTTFKFVCSNQELVEYVLQFGKGAKNKHLTGDVLNLPKNLLKSFVEGFISGDGCYCKKDNTFKISSISPSLIYGLQNCVFKVFNSPCQLQSYDNTKRIHYIEGRLIKTQQISYELRFKKDKRKQDKAFYENGYNWVPFYKIKRKIHNDWVYNIEVEDDNSYCANNIIVHNCQGFSFAGRQLNFKDDRSKLFFEYVRLLEEIKPKYFLLENVKMKKEFQEVISKYMKVEPKLINSALVSAQNRERLYWTNIPIIGLPEDKKIMLKDVVFDDALFCARTVGRRTDENGKRHDYSDLPAVQRLELRTDNKSGTLTTVQKDNTVLTKEGFSVCMHNLYGGFGETEHRTFLEKSPTLRTAAGGGHIPSLLISEKALEYMDRQVKGGRNHWDFGQHSDVRNPKSACVVANFFKGVPFNVLKDWNCIRSFHPIECEKLQTLPEKFTEGISKTQRLRAIGNGWTVDVISWIFSFLPIDFRK